MHLLQRLGGGDGVLVELVGVDLRGDVAGGVAGYAARGQDALGAAYVGDGCVAELVGAVALEAVALGEAADRFVQGRLAEGVAGRQVGRRSGLRSAPRVA